MKSGAQLGRWGALLVFGLAACEVLIMISPFAGFFYASVHFEPFLGFLSNSPATAWLDGFFLNHSVVVLNLHRPSALLGFHIGGIVGHEFLRDYRVTLDLNRSEMRLKKL